MSEGKDAGERLPGAERYRFIRRIAQGAQGAVWWAHDDKLDRQVAIKILRPEHQDEEDAQARFLYEARTTARLTLPGIVPVHDFGTLADGRAFFVMQRIAGRTLADVLQDLARGDEAVRAEYPLSRRLHVFSQICLNLAYAHDQGFIHRDVKPQNILLGEHGSVYLADWGLARPTDRSARPFPATMVGDPLGTPHYMSPEQALGEVDRITPATDVFSLGMLLFELLTFNHPFPAPTHWQVLQLVTSRDVPDPRSLQPDLPPALAVLCRGATRRDVSHRTVTARQLAERVATFLDRQRQEAVGAERARALLGEAAELRARQETLRATVDDRRTRLAAARNALDPEAPAEAWMALWERQQGIADDSVVVERLRAECQRKLEQAIGLADDPMAHDELAALAWEQAEDRARAGDVAGAALHRERVRRHDRSGRFESRLSTHGRLSVRIAAAEATSRVYRYRPFGNLRVAEPVELGEQSRVLAGSYAVEVEAPGRMAVRAVAVVHGGELVELSVDPPHTFPGQAAWVFVPGGDYPLGGDPNAPDALPAQRAQVPSFLIGRHPVTLAEYAHFLNDMTPAQARLHAPRSPAPEPYLVPDAATGTYRLPFTDRDGDVWLPDWPVNMVTWHDAVAYCAWRSAREGIEYRLPTELEWEVAARGADERIYPWGDGFDPCLCRMVASQRGRPRPVPVGSHPFDRSPFGAFDMAGLVVEWTASSWPGEPERRVLRGGGSSSSAAWCRAAARVAHFAHWPGVQFGFRLVRALP